MKKRFFSALRARPGGVMTIFFTLLSTVWIVFFSVLLESARYHAARSHMANVVDMAGFSVFAGFERALLENYEVFGFDGSRGTGDFSPGRVNTVFQSCLEENTSGNIRGLSGFCFDPWQIHVISSKITDYALLSDMDGEYFYQQAVAFMKETAVMSAVGTLFSLYQEAKQAEAHQENFAQAKEASDSQMAAVENAEDGTSEGGATPGNILPDFENPLPALKKLSRRPLLSIVCGDAPISEGSASGGDLCSKRFFRNKGSMKPKRDYGSLTDDLLFREYLLARFPCYTGGGLEIAKSAKLQYQLEYILCGKNSDRANLKSVMQKLLLLREGCNYASALENGAMQSQAGALAGILIGWTGIPALTETLKHALLIGWAYGESLVDARTLASGGKVPLFKTADTWVLSLRRLSKINEILDQGGHSHADGYLYRDYLRILLNLQGIRHQKSRALDMAELNLKSDSSLSTFRADNCLIAMREETNFSIDPFFSRISQAFAGITASSKTFQVPGGFAYH